MQNQRAIFIGTPPSLLCRLAVVPTDLDFAVRMTANPAPAGRQMPLGFGDTRQKWLDIPNFVLVLSGRSQRNRAHGVKGKQCHGERTIAELHDWSLAEVMRKAAGHFITHFPVEAPDRNAWTFPTLDCGGDFLSDPASLHDLKAVNPNRVVREYRHTPAQLLEEIAGHGHGVGAAMARLLRAPTQAASSPEPAFGIA